jgi:hypothetical protein
MSNANYKLTLLSEGINSGPYYNVTYTTSSVYYPVLSGSPAYLPNVGSFVTVQVPLAVLSASYLAFNLNNGIGGCELCDNNVIFVVTGSEPPTTTTTTTTSTTTTTTTIPPTTTTTTTTTTSTTTTTTTAPTYYYYSVSKFDCGSSCAYVSPDLVARSSTPLSTIDGVYYKPLGSFTYQIQTEITPAPMSFDISLDGAPSNANCISACSL